MTRCEEFSRGEYAPRLLAYFLFLKSLLHEITHSGEPVKSIPEIPKIKKLKRRLFLRRLDSFFLSIRHGIEFSKVPVSVNGSRTKTTSTLGSSAKSPGYEESRFSHRGIWKEAHFPPRAHLRPCKWAQFLCRRKLDHSFVAFFFFDSV